MLQADTAKNNAFTEAQYKQKAENLQYNYEVLSKLNADQNMKDFQAKLAILHSPSDFYYERFEIIETILKEKKEAEEREKEFVKSEHKKLMEKLK